MSAFGSFIVGDWFIGVSLPIGILFLILAKLLSVEKPLAMVVIINCIFSGVVGLFFFTSAILLCTSDYYNIILSSTEMFFLFFPIFILSVFAILGCCLNSFAWLVCYRYSWAELNNIVSGRKIKTNKQNNKLPPPDNKKDKLQELKQLYDENLITEQEYEEARKKSA